MQRRAREQLLGGGQPGESAVDAFGQGARGRRRHHAGGGALEQALAESVLGLGQRLGQGRLRQMHDAGGAPHAALAGDLRHRVEMP